MSFLDLSQLRRHYSGQAGVLVTDFYIPVLRKAVRYDRQAGYFDSGSLVQLTAGLAAFIQHTRNLSMTVNPPMRLVTGATWTPDDVAAYQRGSDALDESLKRSLLRHFEPSEEECLRLGLPPGWRPEEDQIARHRLGALAWMVAAGLLEVRIALPLDHGGRPYQPGRFGALYHPKAGILFDPEGNMLSFQGSVNETGAAWTRNREKFEVKRSWHSTQDLEDIQVEIDEFESIWNGQDAGLLALPLPRALREHLQSFAPLDNPPEHDPMETGAVIDTVPLADRIMAQRFLDAPRLPGGEQLVLEPLWADGKRFEPFPHQERVVRRAGSEFPQSFLFCDEVGLGKTIEAGEPLEEEGITIVSRHLIARSDRQDEVLGVSQPWDLIIADEAHAARRKVFGLNEPNQFLQLLKDLRARRLFRSLWLLSATPMQLDPQEVHDLLLLCGLDDPSWDDWVRLSGFTEFFNNLRVFHQNRSVRSDVVRMTRIAVAHGAPDLDGSRVPQHWNLFPWQRMVERIRSDAGLLLALQQLPGNQAEGMTPLLSRQTPLAVHMFRHTRATLRAYQERGLVHGLTARSPEDIPVDFQTRTEQELYHRIDELCGTFYRLADIPREERSGVGFLMAVFRKRLASSFAAFQKSLERRRDLIDAMERDMAEFEGQILSQREFYRDEEEDDDEVDVGRLWMRSAVVCSASITILSGGMNFGKSVVTCRTISPRLGKSPKTANLKPFASASLRFLTMAGE